MDIRIKLHVSPAGRLRMTKEKISARLQIFMKTPQQLRLPLFRKINEHVHAEDTVKLAHVNNLGKVHGSKGDQVAQAGTHGILVANLIAASRKILLALAQANGLYATRVIDAAFSVFKCRTTDVGG